MHVERLNGAKQEGVQGAGDLRGADPGLSSGEVSGFPGKEGPGSGMGHQLPRGHAWEMTVMSD